jgi:hypothetical protein
MSLTDSPSPTGNNPSTPLPIPHELRYTLAIVERIAKDLDGIEHAFMEPEEFKKLLHANTSAASQIYWREILARVHIGSHISLLRTRSWMSGVDAAWTAGNAMLYAAAFRGLLESTADSWFSFSRIPMTLATDHYRILRTINGKSSQMHIAPEIEDSLIHFTHARRLDKNMKATVPKSHEAKQIQTYLQSFGSDFEEVAHVYDRLCAFTHPSAESLMLFVEDYNASAWRLKDWDQRAFVSELHRQFSNVFSDVLMKAFNVPMALLKLLNTFKQTSIATRAVESVDLRLIPVWRQMEDAIDASRKISHRHRPASE